MRYCRQRDTYSCGPIAVLNSMKWAGLPVSYKRLKYMQKTRGFCKQTGVGTRGLYRLLRRSLKETCHIVFSAHPKLSHIIKHLQQGGAVLLLFHVVNDEGHYSLLTDATPSGKTFTIINFDSSRTIMRIRKNILQSCLRRKKEWCPRAWFLRKI